MNTTATPAGLLRELSFDNRFVRELPADPETDNRRRQVFGAAYSRVRPAPVAAPHALAFSREVAVDLLGLNEQECASVAFAETFAGNRLLPAMDPYATCYGGHQFGNWAGQLGDGRAINLGEIVNERDERWALQLKGAGPTPYSRTADGLAVLRSSLREFLCSEAMHHLGVPTTRALSLVTTGESVVRDMLYDGNPRAEPGAVVCRVAPSFTRFGHFQLPAARNDIELLRRFADYTIRTDFAGRVDAPVAGPLAPAVYAAWFDDVCQLTAATMIHWMRVGFVHGVMNTDNMSILGLTIDYGPYGWLEDFDPNWTPNTTDAGGRRYRFAHQPQIALWNLAQLANAIHPLIDDEEPLRAALDSYASAFGSGWRTMMASKLGLDRFDEAAGDEALIDDLLALLGSVETDMTLFFRGLADVDLAAHATAAEPSLPPSLHDAYYRGDQINADLAARVDAWLERYAARVDNADPGERRRRMNAVNPRYVLRNYLAQLAIDQAEQGDGALVNELLDVLRRPYDEQPGKQMFAEKRPEWARHRAGCSMLSCSS